MKNESLQNFEYLFEDEESDELGVIDGSDDFSSLSSSSLKQYYKEISKIPLLSKEEEYELLVKSKNNDEEAINKLLVSNLRLVASVAKKMCFNENDILDAIQNGTLGLLKAIEKYDIDTKYKLSTYAVHWIQQSIKRGQEIDGLSSDMNEKINKIKRVKTDFLQKHGREPNASELAHITGIRISKIEEILKNNYITCSLNALNDDTEIEFGETIPDKSTNVEEQVLNNMYCKGFISNINVVLNIRESEVIALKYGFFDNKLWSFSDISKRLMISIERVSQIHDRAIEKIKERKESFKKMDEDFNVKLEQFEKETIEMKFDVTFSTPRFIDDESMSAWFSKNSFKIFTSKDKICVLIKKQYNDYINKKRNYETNYEYLINEISNDKVRLNLNINSFYDLFPCYDKEDINKIIKKYKTMLYVIYKIHGKNLDEYNNVELTQSEIKHYYYVVDRVRVFLNKKNTLLNKYGKDFETLVLVIYELTSNELINSIYGKIFTLKIVDPLITVEDISKKLNISYDVINYTLKNKKDIEQVIIDTINSSSKKNKDKVL